MKDLSLFDALSVPAKPLQKDATATASPTHPNPILRDSVITVTCV